MGASGVYRRCALGCTCAEGRKTVSMEEGGEAIYAEDAFQSRVVEVWVRQGLEEGEACGRERGGEVRGNGRGRSVGFTRIPGIDGWFRRPARSHVGISSDTSFHVTHMYKSFHGSTPG